MKTLVAYLRLRSVSNTLTSRVPDVLDVLDVDVDVLDVTAGVGSALPVVGISPARIEVDSAQPRAIAITVFFIV